MKTSFFNAHESGRLDISVTGLGRVEFEALMPAMRSYRKVYPVPAESDWIGIIELGADTTLFVFAPGNYQPVSIVDTEVKKAQDKEFVESFPKPEDVGAPWDIKPNERLVKAAEKAGMPFFGCDTADILADEILELRAIIDKASKLIPTAAMESGFDRGDYCRTLYDINATLNEAYTEKHPERFKASSKVDPVPPGSKNSEGSGANDGVSGQEGGKS